MSAGLRISLLGAKECTVSEEGGARSLGSGAQIQANANTGMRRSPFIEPILCAQHMLGTKSGTPTIAHPLKAGVEAGHRCCLKRGKVGRLVGSFGTACNS